ncbi:apolipo protein O-domain-containing protein [Pterulicium gracile]|uniref:MICOS complex subunit n=1 Tax=Pterulicium gracile TaxID=1884261 RepID=A0A5C3QBY6_9AGAR|nr:apolipo protein O-domain-containing protein [Pterula gracilis]
MFSVAARRSATAGLCMSAAAFSLQEQDKPSIYPAPQRELLLVETPSELEKQIGVLRRTLTQQYQEGYTQVQGLVSRWIHVEHAVENRVKSFADPTEPLTPSILYVGIATLSGSIIARNRFIGTRLLLPPALLLLSANHFLPKTTANVTSYLSSLEDTYAPNFADKHRTANAHTAMTWEMAKERTKDARVSLGRGAESLVGKVQEVTGLRVSEALGWGREAARNVEVQVEQRAHVVKQLAEEKVELGLQKAGETLEEIKLKTEQKVEDKTDEKLV